MYTTAAPYVDSVYLIPVTLQLPLRLWYPDQWQGFAELEVYNN